MLPSWFAIVGAFIGSVGGLYYLYCTIRGTVRPNKVTYGLWGLFGLIIFVAQRAAAVDVIAYVTLVATVIPFFIVVAAARNPKAYWRIRPRDYLFGLLAIAGMVLWYLSADPTIAIIFAILADFLAGLPTIMKAYTDPTSEDWRPYAINMFGFLVALLSVQTWTFPNYAFVGYLTVVTFITAVLAARRPSVQRVEITPLATRVE